MASAVQLRRCPGAVRDLLRPRKGVSVSFGVTSTIDAAVPTLLRAEGASGLAEPWPQPVAGGAGEAGPQRVAPGAGSPPDFWRDVYCVFGLPFDAVTRAQAVDRVRDAARSRRRLFLSTPNVNFAAGCVGDAVFRESVVRSDLSTADGAPIVWLARLMGIPLPERVTGADLFEDLADGEGHRVAVYFFGGGNCTADMAAKRLNEGRRPGAHAVGSHSPGFGSLESMSGPAYTEPIDAAGAEFVVVALGARKGQGWITRNWPSLDAPVIAHLGAVVNFVAGTVERSPRWVQRSGFEWLWRITEEPGLWRRYWNDGLTLLRYASTGALPWALRNRRPAGRPGPLRVDVVPFGPAQCLVLEGRADNGAALVPLRQALSECARSGLEITVDLSRVSGVGSAFIALMQLLDGWQRPRTGTSALRDVPSDVVRALGWAGAGYLLSPEGADAGQPLPIDSAPVPLA